MAEPFVWGSLNRAVNDPTVIDEAIETAIAAHNDNSDAHLGEGESLQSHRAAEIIDHLAESVVNDKIRFGARTYAAIVGTEDGDDFTTIEDAVDFVKSKGTGAIYVRAGTYTPTRPLNVTYGVDIYGAGPAETHIDLASSGKKYFNYAGVNMLTAEPIPAIFAYVDSDVVDVSMPDGISTSALSDTYVILPWGDGFILPGAPEGQAYLWDVSPEDGEYDDIVITPSVTCSSSSKIVHVNGWELCSGFDDMVGLTIATTEGDIGIVKSYLGTGDFELFDNALSDQLRGIGLASFVNIGKLSVLQGVSIDFGGSSYAFVIAGGNARLYVRDCTFVNCGGIFRTDNYLNTIDAAGATIEDTNFRFTVANSNLDISGATLRACQLAFASGASAVMIGGPSSRFDDCTFAYEPIANADILSKCQRYARFNGCSFAKVTTGIIGNKATSWSSTNDMYNIFSDCTFSTHGSVNVNFKGYAITVVGCFFSLNGGSVGLNSASRYSCFASNIGGASILSTPTNCQVGLNQVV